MLHIEQTIVKGFSRNSAPLLLLQMLVDGELQSHLSLVDSAELFSGFSLAIQRSTVAEKIEHLDVSIVFLQPSLERLASVNPKVVPIQVYVHAIFASIATSVGIIISHFMQSMRMRAFILALGHTVILHPYSRTRPN